MIGIIDYGLGNLRSVSGAVERLGGTPVVSADAATLEGCTRLILPGVGAFGDGMNNLRERGLDAILGRLVIEGGKPILGICLGAQLMTQGSDEFGDHVGLAWLDADVRRIDNQNGALRVPHVGWDDLEIVAESKLLSGLETGALFYYVHSHRIRAHDSTIVVGECEYGDRFAAALTRENIHAVQFHPEKSQKDGLTVLKNFLDA